MGWAQAILAGVGAANSMYDESMGQKSVQAEIADNKKFAYSAADDATRRGAVLAGRSRTQGSELAAAQKVAYTGAGVDASVGTAANVQASTAATAELDAQTQENNAAREAWGFKRQGLKYGEQAGLEAARSSSRQSATFLTGAGRMVSGAADEYARGKWGQSGGE